MNPIIRVFGISIKFLLINLRAVFLVYLYSKKITRINFNAVDTIVFTHNLGGGTLNYEKQYFNKNNILVIRKISYRTDSVFLFETDTVKVPIFFNKAFNLLKTFKPKTVVVNSLCSYMHFEKILSFIKKNYSSSFHKYLIHDFHCICMKYNLVMNEQYCSLLCEHCRLRVNTSKWREVWQEYFKILDEVICFSQSSKKMLLQVYPMLKNKISVIPHSMDYCTFTKISIDNACNIAVVGNCSSVPKGKNVIKHLIPLVKRLKKRKLYIVGKAPFLFHRNSKYIKYTGEYDLKSLPEILVSGQIEVIVFTSILPETFSYAISEFMQLGLPIVSLDLGAQGEKLHNYPKAVLVSDLKPETIIQGCEKCSTL